MQNHPAVAAGPGTSTKLVPHLVLQHATGKRNGRHANRRSDHPDEVVAVPDTTGPIVPVAAIETAPDE